VGVEADPRGGVEQPGDADRRVDGEPGEDDRGVGRLTLEHVVDEHGRGVEVDERSSDRPPAGRRDGEVVRTHQRIDDPAPEMLVQAEGETIHALERSGKPPSATSLPDSSYRGSGVAGACA